MKTWRRGFLLDAAIMANWLQWGHVVEDVEEGQHAGRLLTV